MPKVKFLLCADSVVVDQITNNTSIFNIIEQLNFETLPVVYPKMLILSLVEKTHGDSEKWSGELIIRIASTEIGKHKVEYNYMGMTRCRNIFTVGGLPITQPGKLEICLYKGTRKLSSYTIDITVPQKARIQKVKSSNNPSSTST